ncbi:class I SAM-dependent methyltransferase [Sediminibacillus albus]|uniref:2-polyprenyl-6-hydroxyphenyl methylase / 3-demethylubiquinone-9 3-methyltransferase n=1 Tax=Sediminibacillus albus TaxID=407036 RepID=A0A1G8ZHA2_9BACI|nr:methyltransferase domain-containing protein [Sediminibacillus albus]SDK13765.1 2-polyprenyl-6-hydroxyphenyl methylase / 3-demethylubiquinone-9 3-methyltransferase [Sediminibacillus albus]
MKKPLDRISEAYFNKMGTKFGEKVRKRIHWVCENSKGEKILDVGCSQGITSILLGREGKQVLGIDLLKESIEHADNLLSDEAEITKQNVEFKTANFMNFDFGEEKYDTIIMGEILEHITDPQRFIKKASQLLADDGQIVITVPFGINDYFDHKKTYFLEGLINLQLDNIKIKNVNFLGEWVGSILTLTDEQPEKKVVDTRLLKKFESEIFNRERNFLSTIKKLEKEIIEIQEVEKKSSHLNKELNTKHDIVKKKDLEITQLENRVQNLSQESETIRAENTLLQEEKKKYKYQYEEQKRLNQENNTREELVGIFKKENDLLKTEVKKQLDLRERELKELGDIQHKHYVLEKRYLALYDSFLGKVTLKYWRFRKKLSNIFRRSKGVSKA